MKIENLLKEKAKQDGIKKNVVGAIITNKNNEILILKRKSDDFMGGIDELPSGKLENSETIFEGLIREIKEETALDVEKVCGYIDSFDYLSSSGKKTRQYNFYVKTKSTTDVKLTEHNNYKWLKIEECYANKNITSNTLTTICLFEYNYLANN